MEIKLLRRPQSWFLVLVAVSMSGCTLLESVPETLTPQEGPSCTLIYRSKNEDIRALDVPLDGMLTVGQLLKDHDALALHRKSIVSIYRKSDDPQHPIRLEIELNGKKVKEEFNYAIFPGDQIVIGPDNSSPFGMLSRFSDMLRM